MSLAHGGRCGTGLLAPEGQAEDQQVMPFLPWHFPSVQKVVVLLWSRRVGNASTLEEDPLERVSAYFWLDKDVGCAAFQI